MDRSPPPLPRSIPPSLAALSIDPARLLDGPLLIVLLYLIFAWIHTLSLSLSLVLFSLSNSFFLLLALFLSLPPSSRSLPLFPLLPSLSSAPNILTLLLFSRSSPKSIFTNGYVLSCLPHCRSFFWGNVLSGSLAACFRAAPKRADFPRICQNS